MAKLLVAVLKCDACDHTWKTSISHATVRCPRCGMVQPIRLPYRRVDIAPLLPTKIEVKARVDG